MDWAMWLLNYVLWFNNSDFLYFNKINMTENQVQEEKKAQKKIEITVDELIKWDKKYKELGK